MLEKIKKYWKWFVAGLVSATIAIMGVLLWRRGKVKTDSVTSDKAADKLEKDLIEIQKKKEDDLKKLEEQRKDKLGRMSEEQHEEYEKLKNKPVEEVAEWIDKL